MKTTLEDVEVTLEPGDAAVQFTDGVSEATEASGATQFGFERIERVIRDAAPLGAGSIVEGIHAAAHEWRGGGAPEDDETVLVASWAVAGRAADSSPVGADPAREPGLAAWAAAQAAGCCLELPARIESLVAIGGWLRGIQAVRQWDDERMRLAEVALYESCCNLVEHAYRRDASCTLEIWWVPDDTFLIRDHGAPFRPRRELNDFADPEVRRRGRGFGFEMIHLAMSDVAYYPGTVVGNITTLQL